MGALWFCNVVAQPANDDCTNAIPLTPSPAAICTNNYTGTLADATPSGVTNTCSTDNTSGDVWFSFVAVGSSYKITTSSNVAYTVYSGSCDNLTLKLCSTATAPVVKNIIPGQTYYIEVYPLTEATEFDICILTLPSITVDATSYTTEALVTQVLGGSTCTPVTNITASPMESIGYFEKGPSDFAFENGIILSTGTLANAPGPNINSGGSSDNGTGNDADLAAFIPLTNANWTYHNATKLEFDFTAVSEIFTLDFIFASEEYPVFQCTYMDAFAFIITDLNNGYTDNIALVPGTVTPINTGTIRNYLYNTYCASSNSAYFDTLYQPSNEDLTAPSIYNGYTVPITATGYLEPGHNYHMKLVIADGVDTAMDSAVFIDGNSLNFGQFNPAAVSLQSTAGDILCNGTDTALTLGNNLPSTLTYSWEYNGEPMPETSGFVYTAEPGDYSVTVSWGEGCTSTYSTTIGSGQIADFSSMEIPPYVLYAPTGTTTTAFDMEAVAQQFLQMPGMEGYSVIFYENYYNATNNINPLTGNFTNTTSTQTLYALVTSPTGCTAIVPVNIAVENYTPINLESVYNEFACEENTDGHIEFTLTGLGYIYFTEAGYNTEEYNYAFYLDTAALAADIPLPQLYTNSIAGYQQVLFKVWQTAIPENAMVSPLNVYVENAAIANPVTPLTACDSDGINDGSTVIDLTVISPELLGSQLPSVYSVGYFTSTDAANVGDVTAPGYIANPQEYTTAGQNDFVWLRVTNTGSVGGCYAITGVEITTLLLPPANTPDTYTITETEFDGVATFDLTTIISQILGEATNPEDYQVYFSYDSITYEPPIQNPESFTNITNPQTLLVTVVDNETGCMNNTFVTLLVESAAGTESNIFGSLKVYPNPAESQLNISSASTLNRAELYTVLGQQVISKDLNSTGTTLDIQNLQAGVYLLKIYSGNSSTTLRVIKK